MASRRVAKKTGATSTAKGRDIVSPNSGKAKAGGKPEVLPFNQSTINAINKAGPKGHELAHILPREGRLLEEAFNSEGATDPKTKIKSYAPNSKMLKVPEKYDMGKNGIHYPALVNAEELETLEKDAGHSGVMTEFGVKAFPPTNEGGTTGSSFESGHTSENSGGGDHSESKQEKDFWNRLAADLERKRKERIAREAAAAAAAAKEAEAAAAAAAAERERIAKEKREAEARARAAIAAAEQKERERLAGIERERIAKEKREAEARARAVIAAAEQKERERIAAAEWEAGAAERERKQRYADITARYKAWKEAEVIRKAKEEKEAREQAERDATQAAKDAIAAAEQAAAEEAAAEEAAKEAEAAAEYQATLDAENAENETIQTDIQDDLDYLDSLEQADAEILEEEPEPTANPHEDPLAPEDRPGYIAPEDRPGYIDPTIDPNTHDPYTGEPLPHFEPGGEGDATVINDTVDDEIIGGDIGEDTTSVDQTEGPFPFGEGPDPDHFYGDYSDFAADGDDFLEGEGEYALDEEPADEFEEMQAEIQEDIDYTDEVDEVNNEFGGLDYDESGVTQIDESTGPVDVGEIQDAIDSADSDYLEGEGDYGLEDDPYAEPEPSIMESIGDWVNDLVGNGEEIEIKDESNIDVDSDYLEGEGEYGLEDDPYEETMGADGQDITPEEIISALEENDDYLEGEGDYGVDDPYEVPSGYEGEFDGLDDVGGDNFDVPDEELLGGDFHDGGDDGQHGGGISIDDPMDDADAEVLGGDNHDDPSGGTIPGGDGGGSIDETDDDPSNDLYPEYDETLDDEILGGDTHDEDFDGGSIDETDDDPTNDLYTYDDVIVPETSDPDDTPLEETPIDTPTGNLSEEDRLSLMGALDKQYGEYRETDYEALYRNEFTDDLNEDYTAATKGLDYNFLTSGDRNQFNTKGNTVNDQQDYLGNLLEGGQNDYLNTMSTNYGRGAINNMNDWYYKNRKGINDLQVADDGTYDFDFTDLDMSSFSDPAASYDPEFYGATAEADSTYFNTGDKLYDKKYENPDKTYYGGIEGGTDPVHTPFKYGDDDNDPRTDYTPPPIVQIKEPEPGTLEGDEMILPGTKKTKKKKKPLPIYNP